MQKNTWGLSFCSIDEKEQNIKLLGLNFGTEQKAKEIFDRIKNEFEQNTGKPDSIIDLIDEEEDIIDEYPLTKNQLVTVASLLGHTIKENAE
ncbi:MULTISPECIES: hypothetical protein [Bacillus amyloliquefaciens group]|uniref:hypothetical protein n=1 Tax=Bacillus amyloliquefaciens group TaxID=1938374 RepID=UPI002E1E64A2|nr:hypothetical protein [Bacillus velezensis]